MMYSCNDSNDLLHAFLTLTCPSVYYMLYHNMSIYCSTLGAIYPYGKIQYCPSFSTHWVPPTSAGKGLNVAALLSSIKPSFCLSVRGASRESHWPSRSRRLLDCTPPPWDWPFSIALVLSLSINVIWYNQQIYATEIVIIQMHACTRKDCTRHFKTTV